MSPCRAATSRDFNLHRPMNAKNVKICLNIWRFGHFSPLAHISKINKQTLICNFKPCLSLFVRLILSLGYSFPLKSELEVTCQILILADFLGGQNVPKLNHFRHK